MCKNEFKKEKKIQCICFFFCYWCFYHHIYESIAKWRLWRFSPSAAANSLQSCRTLWDPIDSSPPGSPVPGILQARTLEWVAISFSNAWKWKVKGKSLNRVRLLVIPWTVAHQTSPSMGFSRQEYWSGVPLPSPKLCSNTNINWKYKDLKREKKLYHFCRPYGHLYRKPERIYW